MNLIAWYYGTAEVKKYVTDARGKGNYSYSIISTGSNSTYAVNNIYDMAGNVEECTLEATDKFSRMMRGGGSSAWGASSRNNMSPDVSLDDEGTRSSLYISP